jgi:hypothetical protein
MWKEMAIGYFTVQHHFPERTEKTTNDIAVVGFQAKNRIQQLPNKTQENQPSGPALGNPFSPHTILFARP